jgi:hypothetical protein
MAMVRRRRLFPRRLVHLGKSGAQLAERPIMCFLGMPLSLAALGGLE